MSNKDEIEDCKAMGWELGKELGSGHFAKVKLVTNVGNDTIEKGHQAALKIIKKPKEAKKKKLVANEHKVLMEMTHPYIVKCYDAFETDDRLYLVMELMPGGELFDTIVDLGHFTEEMAQSVCFKLLGALKFMHDKGVAHRDLKPENMLMTKKGKDGEVKITDFGLSKFFDEQTAVMKTPCGTPGYIAPEVLHMKGYDQQCDIWSFGVIVYILLCGFPPFYADNDKMLFDKIKAGKYEFLKPYWDPISDGAKDFVSKMLVVDPKKRATVDDLLAHEWLSKQAAAAAPTQGLDPADALADKLQNLSTKAELPETKKKLIKLKGAFLAAFMVADTARGD